VVPGPRPCGSNHPSRSWPRCAASTVIAG